MTILKTTHITKRYGNIAAVDHVSLTVQKGDIYGIIGRNGAGKTTFMRLITSLAQPSGGEIALFGETTPAGMAAVRGRIGCVIEDPALYPNLTAVQNLEHFRIQCGIPDKSVISKALEMVNLKDTGNKKIKNFSLGMKQRLGMALALMSNPDFLILDEPTNGMDPIGIVEIRDLIKQLRDTGITFLISSHILTELSQIADKYAILDRGRLVADITQADLHEACKRAIAITVDDVSKAIAVLETTLNIRQYKQISQNELRVYEYLDNPSALVFQLVQNNVRVSALQETGDTLEEYFAELVG